MMVITKKHDGVILIVMLPDDGDHNETCWSYFNFNANFNTPLKKKSLVHQMVI